MTDNQSPKNDYSKQDFLDRWELPGQELDHTLSAIGISPRQRKYSSEDWTRFEEARSLLDSGQVNTFEELAEHYRSQGITPIEEGIASQSDSEFSENMQDAQKTDVARYYHQGRVTGHYAREAFIAGFQDGLFEKGGASGFFPEHAGFGPEEMGVITAEVIQTQRENYSLGLHPSPKEKSLDLLNPSDGQLNNE